MTIGLLVSRIRFEDCKSEIQLASVESPFTVDSVPSNHMSLPDEAWFPANTLPLITMLAVACIAGSPLASNPPTPLSQIAPPCPPGATTLLSVTILK